MKAHFDKLKCQALEIGPALSIEDLNMILCHSPSINKPNYCLDFRPPSGSTGQTNCIPGLAKVHIRADAGCAAYSSARNKCH